MKKYIFRPYNSNYSKLYQEEVLRIKDFLPKETKFEHIGSTAVPGLGGKGFIDILIGTHKHTFPTVMSEFLTDGYNFEPEASTVDRIYFDKSFINPDGDESMFHIHVTYPESNDWNDLLTFRNYLRENRDALEKYATAKKEAAKAANQKRKIYVQIKNPVLFEILKKAKSD